MSNWPYLFFHHTLTFGYFFLHSILKFNFDPIETLPEYACNEYASPLPNNVNGNPLALGQYGTCSIWVVVKFVVISFVEFNIPVVILAAVN